MADDLSETDLSLGDESSFHPSDYSVSSMEESPQTTVHKSRNGTINNNTTYNTGTTSISSINNSRIQKFCAEIVSSQQRQQHHDIQPKATKRYHPPPNNTKSSLSIASIASSESSSESPWMDGTGSSSSTTMSSSHCRTNESIILLSIQDQIRYDNARKRLKASEKRRRSLLSPVPNTTRNIPTTIIRDSNTSSSVSVCTGKDPNKPIDVTNVSDNTTMPIPESLLDNIERQKATIVGISRPTNYKTTRRHDTTTNGNSRYDTPTDRNYKSNNQVTKTNTNNKRIMTSTHPPRLVPPIIVPEFCTSPTQQHDDISSIAIVSLSPYHHYNRSRHLHNTNKRTKYSHRNDIEYGGEQDNNYGDTVDTSETKHWYISFGEWIDARTNLELLLIFIATTSSVGLISLLTIIFAV